MFLSHQTIQSIKYKSAKIKQLIQEYEEYYEAWLQRVRSVEHEENGVTPQMVWMTLRDSMLKDSTSFPLSNRSRFAFAFR